MTGHRETIGRLYDMHGAALYRYALALSGHRAEAEDVVQSVFETLLTATGDAADMREPFPYMLRMARNHIFRNSRRRQRHQEFADADLLIPVPSADPQGQAISREECARVQNALHSLDARQRELVHLHLHQKLSFQDLSEVLGMPASSAHHQYHQALHRIEELLNES